MEKYTKEYYASINDIEASQAGKLAGAIIKMYNPSSVVDLGCGTGLYLFPFVLRASATTDLIGIDFSESAFDPEVLVAPRNMVMTGDLTKKIEFSKKYDVALCLEVVEHIGNEHEQQLVDNITSASDIIVMTAAPPGQAGLNHVNCEPQKHWDELFESRGFHRDYHDEYQIVSELIKVPHTVWIIRNLMVYKR